MALSDSWDAFWTRFDDVVLPKSNAEVLVDNIYGPGGTAFTGKPDDLGDPNNYSSPNVYVQAKGAVTSAIQSATTATTSILTKAGIILAVLLLIYISAYAFISRR